MMEVNSAQLICRNCNEQFFIQPRSKQKLLCGEKLDPPDKNYKPSDCKFYYFCSDECVKEFQEKTPATETSTRWQKFLERIGTANEDCGIHRGVRCHMLKKALKC